MLQRRHIYDDGGAAVLGRYVCLVPILPIRQLFFKQENASETYCQIRHLQLQVSRAPDPLDVSKARPSRQSLVYIAALYHAVQDLHWLKSRSIEDVLFEWVLSAIIHVLAVGIFLETVQLVAKVHDADKFDSET